MVPFHNEMDKMKNNNNDEEFETCISCEKLTTVKKTTNVVYRSGYIEGAGQLCFSCGQIRKMHKTGNYDAVTEWTKYG